MAAGGAYSRMVRVLRVGLPLLAIALLSTIFLVGEDDTLDSPLDLLDDLAEGTFLDNGAQDARFTGVRANGLPYRMRAEEITLIDRDAQRYRIVDPALELEDAAGDITNASANIGTFDDETGVLTLDGNVDAATSAGSRIQATTARLNVETESGTFTGAVVLTLEQGTISAERLIIEPVAADAPEGQKGLIRFEGNVRMVLVDRATPDQE
ncbi:lipopolysaccharide export system protein LptC [Rubricella aquisinus]|uniref:Lipopolysaccharide export system protein LptC n=1 Tax=Rubricella aquisinus TaxID=2028108 RepID=A0A840WGZ4_9RHOB|nr:LPS export ABC transporter periplasmic protein LptC [Rubricella aquisinus]MBB5514389.1 lipopolysaccharide export system protein LptC [Rubricella aquisinus]